MHYGIMHVPTRIFELRALGYKIKTFMKKDEDGKRYASYVLQS